jgi:hypothetical protein
VHEELKKCNLVIGDLRAKTVGGIEREFLFLEEIVTDAQGNGRRGEPHDAHDPSVVKSGGVMERGSVVLHDAHVRYHRCQL